MMDDDKTQEISTKKPRKLGKFKTLGAAVLLLAGAYLADRYDVVNKVTSCTSNTYNKAKTETVDFFTRDPGEVAEKFSEKTLKWDLQGKDLGDFTEQFEDAAYVGLSNVPYDSKLEVTGNIFNDLSTREQDGFLEYVVSNAIQDSVNVDLFISTMNYELNKLGYEIIEKKEPNKLQEYWENTKDFIKEGSQKLKKKVFGEPITSADTLRDALSDYVAEKFLELDDSTRYEVLEKYVTEGLEMRGIKDPLIMDMYVNMNTKALFKKDKDGLKPFIERYIDDIAEARQ